MNSIRFTFFLLFFLTISFSQKNNFKLVYEKLENPHIVEKRKVPTKKIDVVVLGNSRYMVSTTPKVVHFYREIPGEEDPIPEAAVGIPKKTIFKYFDKLEYIRFSDFGRFSHLTKGHLYFFKWKITKETKKINGYNCRKAVSNLKYNQSVTCWFTDELGLNAAPENLDGLPGTVIFAVKKHGNRTINFTLKSISYPKNIVLSKPDMTWKLYDEKKRYSKNFTMEITIGNDEFKH